MSRKHIGRYDNLVVPSEPELYKMYRDEGLESAMAHKKAKEIHDFLNYSVMVEARFWRRVRDNEETAGLEPDIDDRRIL